MLEKVHKFIEERISTLINFVAILLLFVLVAVLHRAGKFSSIVSSIEAPSANIEETKTENEPAAAAARVVEAEEPIEEPKEVKVVRSSSAGLDEVKVNDFRSAIGKLKGETTEATSELKVFIQNEIDTTVKVEDLDNDSARQQYLAQNKVTSASVQQPAPALAQESDDDFIPFEGRGPSSK